ncbi:hypothetical protein BASA50_005803 [Batrachochytrium salamandrivorans]|uniref:non-specific serine/threonine protein kinase n=1 Tax=Batrachochytrium salamandrivorans TaxID=1357716 RepID=A0ABQ8FBP8_9FUNG|nr:hypothetical protein BASA61_010548 [Batrachochytrium salamandrivorans]KAH6595470.1 hypothetical protein BASA50_005803 [Batrachochytrium salamandrivorans]
MTSLYCSLILLLSVATIQVQAIKWDVEGIKGGYHQNQPKLQQPTLHADSPSVKPRLPRPTFMNKKESETYLQIQPTDEYTSFLKKEDMYFRSEYHYVRKLGQGGFGIAHLAIKKSNGLGVVYKTIDKDDAKFYTFESSPPTECHITKVSTLGGKHASAGCMSPRPQNLLLPFEIKIQEYLSQPGYENPYVPRVVDYFVVERAYVLVMEYSGEDWIDLDGYMKTHGKFSVDKARPIIKEVVTALISLKKFGVLHGDIAGRNILYNDRTGGVKIIDFGLSKPFQGWNQDSSASGSSGGKSDTSVEEMKDLESIGFLLYRLSTSRTPLQDLTLPSRKVAEELRNSLNSPESQLAADAVDLVASLYRYGLYRITSFEAILEHPFFTSQ